ncbi:MAG TPA: hypothetical protein VNG12_09270, partial [Acidimicrobiales bacterium]|nr:hypothetical protein [Acidimicrobiales bacterium]
MDNVNGRSLVPSPPTRTTAFIYLVVVVVDGFVVVVVDGFVVVVEAVDDVVVLVGTEVVVDPGAEVVVVGVGTGVVPSMACSNATSVSPLTFGSGLLAGTNPRVMSWPLANLIFPGLLAYAPPVRLITLPVLLFGDRTQLRALTTPFCPASGVPNGHFSPLWYTG